MRKLLFLACFFTAKVYSQDYYYVPDAQVWFNLYLEKEINKHFDLHLNQQDRWTNNVSQFNLAYADVGITWRYNKAVKFLADYVFTQKRRNDGTYSTRHQYYIALVVKHDYRRWRFTYRNMLQNQFNDPYTSSYGLIPYYYERNKFIIKYFALKRYSFYVAEELYMPLNNPQIKGFDRSRTFVGMFYKVRKRQELEFYFLYQHMIQRTNWLKEGHGIPLNYLNRDFIYGIGYSIAF